jgi:NH3-dependent NAD+ synthetase
MDLRSGRPRVIADINTMEQAERVETTIKAGYSEVVIETLLQWIMAEEDLSVSYDKMSKSLPSLEERGAAAILAQESSELAKMLEDLITKIRSLDDLLSKHIKLVSKYSGNQPKATE